MALQAQIGDLGGADVGHDADRGDQAVEQQPLVEGPAAQPVIRVGEHVVDREVEDHRHHRGDGLGHPEHGAKIHAGVEDGEMEDRADQPDTDEADQARRKHAAR